MLFLNSDYSYLFLSQTTINTCLNLLPDAQQPGEAKGPGNKQASAKLQPSQAQAKIPLDMDRESRDVAERVAEHSYSLAEGGGQLETQTSYLSPGGSSDLIRHGSRHAARALSEDRRRSILERLMAERQTRQRSHEGSQDSAADRHERVQQLLKDRRLHSQGDFS